MKFFSIAATVLVLGLGVAHADRRCDYPRSRTSVSVSIGSGPAYPYYGYGAYHYRPYYSRPVVVQPYPVYRYYGPAYTAPVYRGYEVSDLNERVQLSLARKGYYNGEIDGDIGPATRSAIRAYQIDRDLPVSGTIDGSLIRSLGIR